MRFPEDEINTLPRLSDDAADVVTVRWTCSEKHLHRYLSEFDFRYSNRIALGVDDQGRADKTIKGMVGKRLTYRNPNVTAAE